MQIIVREIDDVGSRIIDVERPQLECIIVEKAGLGLGARIPFY